MPTFPHALDCPKLYQRALFKPNSFNDSNHTIQVIWTTGQAVKREQLFKEPFIEELSLEPCAVRLDRLNQGAPVLNSHQHHGIDDVIGVVERAWLDEHHSQGLAEIRFSTREMVKPIIEDVKNGILRNISVGYFVYAFDDVSGEHDSIRTLRAIDWQPHELSLVAINADSGAVIRSKHTERCTITCSGKKTNDTDSKNNPKAQDTTVHKRTHTTMSTTIDNNDTHLHKNTDIISDKPDDRVQENTVEKEKINTATPADNTTAFTEERQRASHIIQVVHRAGLTPTLADSWIREGLSVDEVNQRLVQAWTQRQTLPQQHHLATTTLTRDDTDTRRDAMRDALLHRFNPSVYPMSETARAYHGFSLLDMARDCVRGHQVNDRGLSKLQLAERALHTTSDFPLILSNVANKTLRDAYEAAPQTFKPFVRIVSVSDFKPITRVQLGDAPALEKVNEHGEFTYGTLGEAEEQYRIYTFGKVMSLTRQTIINDDLDAFTRIPQLFGRSAANLESELVYRIITTNPVMGDKQPLFCKSHQNIASQHDTLTIDSMSAARQAMRLQTSINGQRVNVIPRYLLVPAQLETLADQFISQQFVPNTQTNINPFAGRLQIITEPRLDSHSQTTWYLLASPQDIDMIELAYLQGQQGVYLETQSGFDIDGIKIKARLDVGAKAIDWRGFYKNEGDVKKA